MSEETDLDLEDFLSLAGDGMGVIYRATPGDSRRYPMIVSQTSDDGRVDGVLLVTTDEGVIARPVDGCFHIHDERLKDPAVVASLRNGDFDSGVWEHSPMMVQIITLLHRLASGKTKINKPVGTKNSERRKANESLGAPIQAGTESWRMQNKSVSGGSGELTDEEKARRADALAGAK